MPLIRDRIRTVPSLVACVALAATLANAAFVGGARAEPGEIRGQDVKGDRDKSANDGWSQAPVPREESAAKDADNPGGGSTEMNRNRKVGSGKSTDNSADDPQKAMDHRTPSPSGDSPATPSRK